MFIALAFIFDGLPTLETWISIKAQTQIQQTP